MLSVFSLAHLPHSFFLSFKNHFKKSYTYVFLPACMFVYHLCPWCPQSPEEDIVFSEPEL